MPARATAASTTPAHGWLCEEVLLTPEQRVAQTPADDGKVAREEWAAGERGQHRRRAQREPEALHDGGTDSFAAIASALGGGGEGVHADRGQLAGDVDHPYEERGGADGLQLRAAEPADVPRVDLAERRAEEPDGDGGPGHSPDGGRVGPALQQRRHRRESGLLGRVGGGEKRLLRGGEQRLAKPWLALQQPWLALVCESRAVSAEEDESASEPCHMHAHQLVTHDQLRREILERFARVGSSQHGLFECKFFF